MEAVLMRVDWDRVRHLAALEWDDKAIAADVGCHPTYAKAIRMGKIKRRADGGSVFSRQQGRSLSGKTAPLLPYDNSALMDGRTIYPATVISPLQENVLKSGFNSSKIGKRIVKGRWKGFEVYTLTLEERATCPISCRHWRSCFGNNMHHAHRFRHGPDLEKMIEREVIGLVRKHPRGFAIRLHVLGDFYSVQYVELWARLLREHRTLHAFGFTARWDYNKDAVARALIGVVEKNWSRFAIRFSNAPIDELATVSIEHPLQKPDDAIICPQQLGKTECCSTCALCWQSKKRIAFIQH